ncbi:MAG TPA: UGSC family (seleno)protein [Syntrophorhabdales bacterium]|nr:UGSC family (seleno)protein [Syntrophorhabdales bacterium]
MTAEKLGIPTAPVVTHVFRDLVEAVAFKGGMAKLRFVFVPHPVGGQPTSTLRAYALGSDPLTGRPVLDEIVEALTKPLADEDEAAPLDRSVPRFVEPDTEERLHRLFLEKGWTDGLPIVLPTEKRVAEMLSATSRRQEEVVGRMRPTQTQEDWEYTVEKVAVNAVMAGAEPSFFPVILAIAATEETALHSSTSSFASMAVVNGPIRHEIGMNGRIGAMGPFNHANAAIGRAYSLLSRNLGGGAIPGVTYLASQGNPLTYNGLCFPENEERSPWEPFHVSRGFKQDESIVSIFRGRGLSHLLGVRAKTWRQQFTNLVAGITPTPGANLTLLLDPLVARALKEKEGFHTKASLSEWFYENSRVSAEVYWDYQVVINYIEPLARKGVEPFASWLKLPGDALIPRFSDPRGISIVVVGGETNAYWFAADFAYLKSRSIDEWR